MKSKMYKQPDSDPQKYTRMRKTESKKTKYPVTSVAEIYWIESRHSLPKMTRTVGSRIRCWIHNSGFSAIPSCTSSSLRSHT